MEEVVLNQKIRELKAENAQLKADIEAYKDLVKRSTESFDRIMRIMKPKGNQNENG